MDMMRRHVFVAGVALAVLATACTAEEEPERDDAAEEVTDDDGGPGEPDAGGELVAALSSEPGGLNPAITTSGAVHFASHLFYNGLVDLDDDLEPTPELADSWDVEDDGALYRFHLRDDVTWHDGEPFTAEDVKFTFDEVLFEFHARTAASVGSAIDEIVVVDEHTVEFHFDEPYAPLLQQLDVGEAAILPRHVFEGTDILENPANDAPVGTGPFQFVSYTPDSEIVLEANEDYTVRERPFLDRVVLRIMPEASSQVIALETGEVDWVWRIPEPDVQRFDGDPDVEMLQTFRGAGSANCPMTMGFNLDRPVTSNLDVRTAIAHALDREAFVERVLHGAGQVPQAPVHSNIEWATAEDAPFPEHDLEEAGRLLDAAGWVRDGDDTRVAQGVEGVEDGTPFEIDFLHFPTFVEYGELLRSQLAEIGIDVELRTLEPPVFIETVFEDRDFDTNIISYCQSADPEIGVRRMFDSEQIGPVPFSNAAGYANPEVDALFQEAVRTVGRDARGELYRGFQRIVAEDLPYIMVTEPLWNAAHTARCTGFKPYNQFAEQARCEQ